MLCAFSGELLLASHSWKLATGESALTGTKCRNHGSGYFPKLGEEKNMKLLSPCFCHHMAMHCILMEQCATGGDRDELNKELVTASKPGVGRCKGAWSMYIFFSLFKSLSS